MIILTIYYLIIFEILSEVNNKLGFYNDEFYFMYVIMFCVVEVVFFKVLLSSSLD